jgi:hypothetical protein
VNLVREDGTKASTWNDYRKVGRVSSATEDRFGLRHVPGRMAGRTLPEPSRADREISVRNGDPEPLRIRLERKVRACAAVATSEDHFTRLARDNSLLVRPRYGPDGATITGYAFADQTARRGSQGPIWFGGGKLAPDLTVTGLRRRWRQATPDEFTRAADLAAAAAISAEPDIPGPLSTAARHMARAVQHPATAALAVAADTFIALSAPAAPELQLFRELEALVAVCMTAASTTTAPRQNTLIQTGQPTRDVLEETVTEPTHEDEFLDHLTRAGILGANIVRTALAPTGNSGLAGQAEALRRAGYTETTPHDGQLRELFGEQRWAMYASDPARIVAAAAITDAANAGHDVPAVLRRVVNKRAWEDDQMSAARSIAGVLAYRIERDVAARARRRTPAPVRVGRTDPADKTTRSRSPRSMASTPFDAQLENLLGEHRWRQYAEDPRRAAVAELITQAAGEGRDVRALLSEAVTSREFEDDPMSPARRIAGVLHYRLRKALELPPETADRLAQAHAATRVDEQKNTTTRAVQAQPARAAQRRDGGRDI